MGRLKKFCFWALSPDLPYKDSVTLLALCGEAMGEKPSYSVPSQAQAPADRQLDESIE